MKTILEKGISALQQSDMDIEALAAPRKEELISLLERYIAEIELFNPAYGLVGTNNHEELIVKHILDSLAPLGIIYRLIKEKDGKTESALKIADAGSGAGLPGMPLAAALPKYEFTLIERMGRRAGFLWNTKAALGLSNVAIEEGEIERTAPESFDIITFRAFKPLEPKLLKALFRACSQDGCLAAYKGKSEKIATEMAPLEKLCGSWEAIPCPVPFLEEERHMVIIRPLV